MQFRLAILMLSFLCTAPLSLWAAETKDVKFPIKNADSVVFSHTLHLKKYNNNCKVCHNAIFDLKSRRHFTMAEMERTKSCGACHTGVKAFSVADSKSCTRCHKGGLPTISYKVKGGDAAFSHAVHVSKLNGQCKACHNGTTFPAKEGHVTMAQMAKGKSCGTCHNGKKAFTVTGFCGNCHKGMKPRNIEFKVQGISSVTFSHDLHTSIFPCNDCHTKLFEFKAGAKHNTMADMNAGKSCGACHNGDRAFSVKGGCYKCHKGFKPGPITFKSRTGTVHFSHEKHLTNFGCADCHTKIFPYKAGAKHYTMGQMSKGASCGVCHNGADAFATTGDCDRCHTK